ncbi:GIY-YIG nuclease family protein [Deinococcus yavapaiensis]|uniref:Uncharacterized protein n=1 Tax=Deinococcus yavapaiensis KR-236 TaxID=694435 RepID=A0A318S5X5_9DEIO|nr:GIY-YIG nuclease family protein [Deinococcus yavapaiensis]PYE49939.1 hypothetical protein DES52_12017 [Deinococcus yavapaiensis KR-236]
MSGQIARTRAEFDAWLSTHRPRSAVIAVRAEPLDRRAVLARVASLTGAQRDDAYVTLLLERRPVEDTPAFVEATREPLRRWATLVDGLLAGEGAFARWRTRLLFEGKTTSRFDLRLYVVGEGALGEATADETVEALATWARAAFPLRLLDPVAPPKR